MKTISLYDENSRFKYGQIVAIESKWVLFKIVRGKGDLEKGEKLLEFSGMTHGKKPCGCGYCTLGGVGSAVPVIPNTSKNCRLFRQMRRIEKKQEKK